MPKQSPSKKSVYKNRRYWYHISTTLKPKYIKLIPWGEDKGHNRNANEPDGNRICVAPSIEQCIAAIPYYLGTRCNIYRTKVPVRADQPNGVFDANVTQEGWLHQPTHFVKIGILKFSDVEKHLGVKHVIGEAASDGCPRRSGKVLKWWKNAKVHRFIKKA